jgi:hypothetical protein
LPSVIAAETHNGVTCLPDLDRSPKGGSGLNWFLNALNGGVTLGPLCTNGTHPAQHENPVSL